MCRRGPVVVGAFLACLAGALGTRVNNAHGATLSEDAQWPLARIGALAAAGLSITETTQAFSSKDDKSSRPDASVRRSSEPYPALSLQDLPQSFRRKLHGKLKPVARNRFGTIFEGTMGDPMELSIGSFPKSPNSARRFGDEFDAEEDAMGTGLGVLTMYGSPARQGNSVYITEEVAMGSLQERVINRSFTDVSFVTRIRLFAEILHAVDDMNRMGVVHGKVSPEKVLVIGDCSDAGGRACSAVLCDLDGTCSLPGGMWPDSIDGRPPHMAPEARLNQLSDVYALGIMLFGMFAGPLPEAGPVASLEELLTTFEASLRKQFSGSETVWKAVPRLMRLIKRMAQPDPDLRIDTSTALRDLEQIAKDCGFDISPQAKLPWSTEVKPNRLKVLMRRIFRRSGPRTST